MNLRDFKTVKERREALEKEAGVSLQHSGNFSLDEAQAATKNCENMIGITQIPLGVSSPLQLRTTNNELRTIYLPLATTEGALVASISRGCKAIFESGGAEVKSHRIGTTRGPVFKLENLAEQNKFHTFLDTNFAELKILAESTSSHLMLKKHSTTSVGKYRYVRFYFDTQDAMGMNMVTIATQKIVTYIESQTPARCIAISGNFCSDKKASMQNFINHRGIEAWAEVVIPHNVLETVLKTTAEKMYEVWLAKNMLGSALVGALGLNAHAANVLAALFLATGQDVAHVVEGSMAVTTTEIVGSQSAAHSLQTQKGALYISVFLPDLMLGTVGGGTNLATQQEALQLLGVAGGDEGKNALAFAEIASGAVLAGEISLLASLTQGTLAKAHERLGRDKGKA